MQALIQLPLSARWFPRFRVAGKARSGFIRRGLPLGRILRRPLAGGARIDCVSGVIWVTLESVGEDILLSKGDSFMVDRGGVAVVESLENAVVEIQG
jgi:hypothetical protein